MKLNRREVLVAGTTLGTLFRLGARAGAQDEAKAKPATAPAFRISLAQWSLHKALFAGELLHEDFAKVARQRYHVDAIEYVSAFFKEKRADTAQVRELKRRADELGVRSLLIMIDGEGELGHADAAERKRAVEQHKPWLDAAKGLGCHSIRVNAYGSGSAEEHAARAAESLHALALLADPLALNVIVENHGGRSSNGAWLAGVMKAADHPRVGTLPDFGNFKVDDTTTYDRYQGVREMMPFAKAVSAKSYDFDKDGNETTIDYEKMLKIVVAAGYHGYVGIEYEGERLSEPVGILATKALLERVRSRLP
jgi:L-ribulose-5-phosphate 3-epimerase